MTPKYQFTYVYIIKDSTGILIFKAHVHIVLVYPERRRTIFSDRVFVAFCRRCCHLYYTFHVLFVFSRIP